MQSDYANSEERLCCVCRAVSYWVRGIRSAVRISPKSKVRDVYKGTVLGADALLYVSMSTVRRP